MASIDTIGVREKYLKTNKLSSERDELEKKVLAAIPFVNVQLRASAVKLASISFLTTQGTTINASTRKLSKLVVAKSSGAELQYFGLHTLHQGFLIVYNKLTSAHHPPPLLSKIMLGANIFSFDVPMGESAATHRRHGMHAATVTF